VKQPLAAAELSQSEARRIALAAQGFDRPRPRGRVGLAPLRRIIRQLGLLQIDYVNVLVPAQYQVPFTRLGPYDRTLLDDLVYRRREFTEQWAREACIVPVESWPLFRPRADDRRARWLAAFARRHAAYLDEVLERVRAKGPLTRGEVPEPNGSPRPPKRGFWNWSLAKTALEYHFASGTLAVAERRSKDFARAYDLTERVVPEAHRARDLPREEAHRELLRRAARSLGIGTAGDLADYYRLPIREARRLLLELARARELREVRVEGWKEPAYLHPEARAPRSIEARSLLSPFDPVVWHRPRVARLFDFEYTLEIWVPQAQRRWGYYVLPFLMGDRLVARVDLKSDREAGRLLVAAAHVEPGVERAEVAEALADELATMAAWLQLDGVKVQRRGGFSKALAAAVRG
jgi:uncharacterized protein YcaQ